MTCRLCNRETPCDTCKALNASLERPAPKAKVWDPNWRYTPSHSTDIRETFRRFQQTA
jgi:hypothetical protein